MPDGSQHSSPVPFFSLAADQVRAEMVKLGLPDFRAGQLLDWVYDKLIDRPAEMTNFSRRDQQRLAEHFIFSQATVSRHQSSSDGTEKLLLTWPGGANAETVMIPDDNRRTACISSQVGCPVGCKFCASGLEGVKGNLSAEQIVEQVFMLNRVLEGSGFRVQSEGSGFRVQGSGNTGVPTARDSAYPSSLNPEPRTLNPLSEPRTLNPRITNIVFMGMGEPMANYPAVMQAVRVLHDPKCFNLGARRITISTVGVPAKMRQLAAENLPVNLALSLHAPNEPLRKQLIPWAEHFSLDEILAAARYYFDRTGREITLEYILLSGVNDRPEHARQLARLCKTMRANVNLIRYNEVEALPFKRPAAHDVVTFQQILRDAGVNAHVRKSRGRDIAAACGQLRRETQRATN